MMGVVPAGFSVCSVQLHVLLPVMLVALPASIIHHALSAVPGATDFQLRFPFQKSVLTIVCANTVKVFNCMVIQLTFAEIMI
jgi:hypothetical protein